MAQSAFELHSLKNVEVEKRNSSYLAEILRSCASPWK
jgi:hypothetical protein